jgi:hypothetical protein
MSFIDKVKGAVKTGAEQAAAKAQEEYSKLQVRRELSDAYETLGAKVVELADRGEISHAQLTPLVEQARAAKARLEGAGKEPEPPQAAPPAPDAEAPPPTT